MEKQEEMLRLFARVAAAVLALCACLVLLGWMCANPVLESFLPGPVAMNPCMAIVFLMTAIGLACHATTQRTTTLTGVRFLIGGLILVCGISVIVGSFLDWQTGIDGILFANALGEHCMAPNTATYFAFLGSAFLLLETRLARKWPVQSLALIVLGGSIMSLLGYGYGARNLYGVGNYIPMALNTALLFLTSALGLLCISGPNGFLSLFAGSRSGSAMARQLLRTAVAVPCVLGFYRVLGPKAGFRRQDEQLRNPKKMEAVDTLADDVAHEFNNLLQAVLGYTRFAMSSIGESHQAHADLQVVVSAAERAALLTQQLLTRGRREMGQPTPFDVNVAVHELAMVDGAVQHHGGETQVPEGDAPRFLKKPHA